LSWIFLFVKAKSNYEKGDLDWTIELSTTTEVTIVLPFDPPIKLFFHLKDIINSFGRHMFQPFATTTIAFAIIDVHGEINGKFELLVANGTS
jgi:hypothetical protein